MYNSGYFYNAIKRDISMVRGDTLSFAFQLKGLEGQTPEKVTFTCKETLEDEEPLFIVSLVDTIDIRSYDAEKDLLTYIVRVPPYKTASLELGRYFYDLEIAVNGDIITLMIGRLDIEYEVHRADTPEPRPIVLIEKTIEQNGTYSAENDNADGYSEVVVNVPSPILITKTITENGTYNATDDDADGYDEVIINVPSGAADPERLVYFIGEERDINGIPAALNIIQGSKYSEYMSYDSSTKIFTVLKAFDAMVACWVREYRDYYSDYSRGGFQKNGSTISGIYYNSGQAINSVGGRNIYVKFAVGDTFNAISESNAYPQQHFKMYLLDEDMPSAYMEFSDEEV